MRGLFVGFEQGLNLIDVFLLRLILAHAFQLGPAVVLGAANHIQHARTLAGYVPFAALLEVGIEKQQIVIAGALGQGFDILLSLLECLLGHGCSPGGWPVLKIGFKAGSDSSFWAITAGSMPDAGCAG